MKSKNEYNGYYECALCGRKIQTIAQFREHARTSHSNIYERHVDGRSTEFAYFSRRALLPITVLSILSALAVVALNRSDPHVYEFASFAASDTAAVCMVSYVHVRGRSHDSYNKFMMGSTLYQYLLDQCIICGELIQVRSREEHLLKVHESELKYHRFVKSVLNAFLILSAIVTWSGLQLIFIFGELSKVGTFLEGMGLCAVSFTLVYLIYMNWLYRRWTNQWRTRSQARGNN